MEYSDMNSEMNDVVMNLTKHVDVIRKYHDGKILSVFILENQSYVDYSMVIRAAYYEFLTYDRILKKLNKNKMFSKNTKLPMVYVLVFYTGERAWSAARKLSEIVEVDESFKEYFHDYEMNMIEICSESNYNFNEKDVHDLVYLSRAIFDQSIQNMEVLKQFQNVNASIVRLVEQITEEKWIDDEKLKENGSVNMCEAVREWEATKIQQGINLGKQDEKKSMYQTMIQNGLSIEQIAKYCSVSVESIQKLIG